MFELVGIREDFFAESILAVLGNSSGIIWKLVGDSRGITVEIVGGGVANSSGISWEFVVN